MKPRYGRDKCFLVAGDTGAAAVMGATALSNAYSEELLGIQLTPLLVQPGTSIGDAMLVAKTQLTESQAPDERVDVLLGWILLGDPAIVSNHSIGRRPLLRLSHAGRGRQVVMVTEKLK